MFKFDNHDRFDFQNITLLINNTTQENINPPWMLRCICSTTKCQCLAKVYLYNIYIKGATREHFGPLISRHDFSILMVDVTFTQNIYNPLINAIPSIRVETQPQKGHNNMSSRGHSYKQHRRTQQCKNPRIINQKP